MPDMKPIGELRKVVQDLLTPELRALQVEIAHVKEELPQMERRIVAAIASSEQKLTLMFELAQANARIEELQNKLEKQRSESSPQ